MGDLYRALGQGEKAREAYLQALAIRERLAQAEPDRAAYQVDLAVSLARVAVMEGGRTEEILRRALAILLALKERARLAPEHEDKIRALNQMLGLPEA